MSLEDQLDAAMRVLSSKSRQAVRDNLRFRPAQPSAAEAHELVETFQMLGDLDRQGAIVDEESKAAIRGRLQKCTTAAEIRAVKTELVNRVLSREVASSSSSSSVSPSAAASGRLDTFSLDDDDDDSDTNNGFGGLAAASAPPAPAVAPAAEPARASAPAPVPARAAVMVPVPAAPAALCAPSAPFPVRQTYQVQQAQQVHPQPGSSALPLASAPAAPPPGPTTNPVPPQPWAAPGPAAAPVPSSASLTPYPQLGKLPMAATPSLLPSAFPSPAHGGGGGGSGGSGGNGAAPAVLMPWEQDHSWESKGDDLRRAHVQRAGIADRRADFHKFDTAASVACHAGAALQTAAQIVGPSVKVVAEFGAAFTGAAKILGTIADLAEKSHYNFKTQKMLAVRCIAMKENLEKLQQVLPYSEGRFALVKTLLGYLRESRDLLKTYSKKGWTEKVKRFFNASSIEKSFENFHTRLTGIVQDLQTSIALENAGKLSKILAANNETGEVAAPLAAPVVAPGAATAPLLPPGWEQCVDPSTGKAYYIDHTTRSTHWTLPRAMSAEQGRALLNTMWG